MYQGALMYNLSENLKYHKKRRILKMKRFFSLILCIAMIATAIFSMSAVTAAEVANGECGSALTWSLDDEGTLTISGEGYMYSYSADAPAPWAEHAQNIKKVIIEDGVISIGKYAFAGCTALESIVFTAAYHPYIPVTEFAVDTPYKLMATNSLGTIFANTVSGSLKATPSASNARDFYLEAATTIDGEAAYRFYYYYGETKSYFYLASSSTTGLQYTETVPLYKEVVDETTGETVQGDEISTVWVYNAEYGAWTFPEFNDRYLATDTTSSREDIRCYAKSNMSKTQYSIAKLAVKDPTKTEIEGVAVIYANAFDGCAALTNIYCRSTEEAWASTHIDAGNDVLAAATVTYNYVEDNGGDDGEDDVVAPEAIELTTDSKYIIDEEAGAIIVKLASFKGDDLHVVLGNIATDAMFYQVVDASGSVVTSVSRITRDYSIQLLNTDGTVNKTYQFIVLGDCDNNGRIAATDVSKLKAFIKARYAKGTPEYLSADVDGSGKMAATDTAALVKSIGMGAWN